VILDITGRKPELGKPPQDFSECGTAKSAGGIFIKDAVEQKNLFIGILNCFMAIQGGSDVTQAAVVGFRAG